MLGEPHTIPLLGKEGQGVVDDIRLKGKILCYF